jgi:hypothetical protein
MDITLTDGGKIILSADCKGYSAFALSQTSVTVEANTSIKVV